MDGSPVLKGDYGYDILLGAGVVQESDPVTGFAVSFGSGRVFRYDITGSFHGQKRFYWSNPVLRVPKKVDSTLPLIQRLILAADNAH
jgi:hypothetical protein